MLSNRLCSGCGRQVRLAATIQSPRCPACRLSLLPPVPETRPCLRCYVPIPADSPYIRCMRCEAIRSSTSHSYSPCYDCRALFPTQRGVIRCIDCRSRRSIVVQRPMEFNHTHSISFDPTLNSFQPLNTLATPRQPKRQRTKPPGPPRPAPPPVTAESEKQGSVITRAIAFLLQEHKSRVLASGLFPPDISTPLVRQSIARFGKQIAAASKDVACCSCGVLIPSSDTRRVLDGDPVLALLEGFLDHCGYTDDFWNFCSGCHAALLRGNAPKFSAKNNVNVLPCQHYPETLKDLTLTEEYVIAKSHPVGVILKLRPGGRSSPANYHALRGHFIIIPQDPKPLL